MGRLRPSKRRLIQLYAALLYNAHLRGFVDGTIFQGATKAVCVPGLNCYSCPGAAAACPLGALQNALASANHRLPYYALGLLALFGLVLGRVVCGFLCPFGLLQELLHKIPTPKIPKGRVTRRLSYLKYGILGAFVIGIPLWYLVKDVAVPGFCKYICPAGTLEGAVALLAHPANEGLFGRLGGLFGWKLALMAAILALCVFLYRAFCRFLCPLGAIYGLFCRVALLGVEVDANRCTNCGRCVAVCPVDIRRVGDHECVQCGACVKICPEGAIAWRRVGTRKKAPWKKILCAAALAAVLIGALWYCNRAPSEDMREIGSAEGMLCPDFSAELYGGGTFRVSEQRGKVTVVNFWATWCAPCCEELPQFDRLREEFGNTVSVVAVHSKLQTDDPQAFLDGKGYEISFAWDADGSAAEAVGGAAVLPQTVVLDRDGVIVYNRAGSLDYETLAGLVKPLLDN